MMMAQNSKEEIEAAQLLWRHWQAGTRIDALPEGVRPIDRAAGYRIGACVTVEAGEHVVGWKIAATSKAGQAHINVDAPLGGRLLSGRILKPYSTLTLGHNIMKVAEVEFAFCFARALPPRGFDYSYDEVMDAVQSLHPSIEIPDSRYNDFTSVGAPSLIADTACASWLMVGDSFADIWRSLDLAEHEVHALKANKVVASGAGKAALGDPRNALHWLVNEVSHYAEGIKSGDVVTTGTCVVPVPIAPGDHMIADYGILGRMGITIV
jgi:2-keto-4-pentenoate hydratase